MTTTKTKGRITGAIALTMATDLALAEGDHVHVIDDYKVGLADGTKRIIGSVSVRSVKRVVDANSSQYPVATTTGGEVTVEAYGYSVETRVCGAAIAAGAEVGIDASSEIVTAGVNVATFGVALTHTTAAGQEIDILVTGK